MASIAGTGTAASALPDATVDLETAKRDITETGLCIIPGALSPDTLGRVRERLYLVADEDIRLGRPGGGAPGLDFDPANQRVWGLLNRGQEFVDLVEHPMAVALLLHVLGHHFLLSSLAANITGPGHGGMKTHNDQGFIPQPWPEQPQGLNIFWAIDDFTEDNGGTLIAPGSHRYNRLAVPDDDAALLPLTVPAGTMVAMDGRVWHRTGANRTNTRRAGIFGWHTGPTYRTQENWFLSLNPLILQGNPSDRLLTMLGYKVDLPYFGHSNGYDPMPARRG